MERNPFKFEDQSDLFDELVAGMLSSYIILFYYLRILKIGGGKKNMNYTKS